MSEKRQTGVGVDAFGGSVIDPSENVRALNEASIKRVDDMMALRSELVDAKLDIAKLRADHNLFVIQMHANHQAALDEKESSRLDSVRQVDQLAVKTESDRAAVAISALATTTAAMAETLRSAQTVSAATLATQFDRTMAQANERIAALERSSYIGAGRAGVADPQIDKLSALVEHLASAQAAGIGKSMATDPAVAAMAAEVNRLASAMATGTGRSAGGTAVWAYVVAGVGLIATLLSIAVAAFALLSKI